MSKFIKASANGSQKFIASVDQFPGVQPEMLLARKRVGIYSSAPAGATELDVKAYMGDVLKLEAEINSQLVKMTEPIHCMLLGLLTGDNVFMLSLPGAAKTTMTTMLGSAVEGDYFRKNFTPDMSASDLFGPPSMAGVQKGVWTRDYSGLATATVGMTDEFYKGSQTIQNSVLDVAEERTVSDPTGTRNVPLLLLVGASNEVTNADERSAIWDRWMIRSEVVYPNRRDDILAAFNAVGGRVPITVKLAAEDVLLIQALVEYMSLNLPDAIKEKMADILGKLQSKGIEPSPRRWFGWGRCIVAETLLSGGGSIKSNALLTGTNILWIKIEDREDVLKIVGGTSSPERATIMGVQSDIEKIRNNMATVSDMNEITKMISSIKNYTEQVERRVNAAEFEDDKKQIISDLQTLKADLLMRLADVCDPTNNPTN